MWVIDIDGQHAFYQGDEDVTAFDIQIDLQAGDAGTLKMTLPHSNPTWGAITTRQSIVTATRDGREVFRGEVRKKERDVYGNMTVTAYGELAWLSDSIQPQKEFHDISPRAFLKALLDVHNEQCPEHAFEVGMVTVTDSNQSLYRYTNREDTLSCMRDKLVDRLGGYLRVRNSNGVRYLDYVTIDTYGSYSTQDVRFGENIVEYMDGMTVDDVCSSVVPLGTRLENQPDNSKIGNLEKRLTIESVNDGKDYIVNQDLVQRFGNVRAVKTWDDVTVPSNLLKKGTDWLRDEQFERMHITVRAVDLSLTSKAFGELVMGDRVRVVCPHLALDRYFPIMRRTYEPDDPSREVLELGSDIRLSYVAARGRSQRTASSAMAEVQHHQSAWLTDAIDNVTAMLTGSRGGYKLTEYDEQGRWVADYYLDAPVKEQAKYVHKVTVDGDGYSTNGVDGPYETAIMADGTILGKFIQAHSVSAEQISVDYTESWENADTATLNTARTEFRAADSEIRARVSAVEETADGLQTDLSAEIKLRADQIAQTVKRGEISSTIEQTAETIFIKSNKFGWSSSNSSMSTDGTLKAKNAVLENCTVTGTMSTTGTGTWSKYVTSIEGGFVNFLYGSNITSSIKTRWDKTGVGNGMSLEAGTFNGGYIKDGSRLSIGIYGLSFEMAKSGNRYASFDIDKYGFSFATYEALAGSGNNGSVSLQKGAFHVYVDKTVWIGHNKCRLHVTDAIGDGYFGQQLGTRFAIDNSGKGIKVYADGGNIYLDTKSGGHVYANGTRLD